MHVGWMSEMSNRAGSRRICKTMKKKVCVCGVSGEISLLFLLVSPANGRLGQ